MLKTICTIHWMTAQIRTKIAFKTSTMPSKNKIGRSKEVHPYQTFWLRSWVISFTKIDDDERTGEWAVTMFFLHQKWVGATKDGLSRNEKFAYMLELPCFLNLQGVTELIIFSRVWLVLLHPVFQIGVSRKTRSIWIDESVLPLSIQKSFWLLVSCSTLSATQRLPHSVVQLNMGQANADSKQAKPEEGQQSQEPRKAVAHQPEQQALNFQNYCQVPLQVNIVT